MPAGLNQTQAVAQLARDGPNELPPSQQRGWLGLLRDVVLEPMFLLLVACGGIYMLLGKLDEALMLLAFVFVVMGISLVQATRTARSLDALRDLSSPQALVLRDGEPRKVPGRELVCDDVVLIAEGDRVPADLELLQAANLTVDESMLTGESVPVGKQANAVAPGAASPPTTGDECRVFSGTLVTQGTAQGRVIATGERSALGRIGQSLQGLGAEATPIQKETRKVVKWVAVVGLLMAAGLAVAYGLRSGDWLQGVLAGLTFAMAVVPEELPVVLTLFLGLGAWRLARENVLVRNLPAIERLGATTVLCVDKTGTLTANRMAVRHIWSQTANYDSATTDAAPASTTFPDALHDVLEFAVLASHRQAFDPMETAIAQAGATLLANTEHLHSDWALVDDYPLSPAMLAMSRVWQSPDQRDRLIAAKGAPEAIADLCHADAALLAHVAQQVAAMAKDGLRVLGVARARFAAPTLPDKQHDFDFEFLGLIALQDPVRPDVPAAIAQCHAAGIRVVMVTGDHSATALSIAGQAGLSTNGKTLSGAQLAALTDEALAARLADTNTFCRVQPDQKLRLVQAFQACGEVVAMTGDGVNDAPALKAASIGVAMGARGTDVARQAADLVLLKDDFASLVTAVRYGRRIFANLRKAIVFVVAVHIPIMGLSLLPVMLGWPLLLMPVHILFLQLIIDPTCTVVFEAEPEEGDAMQCPPRPADAHLFGSAVLVRGVVQGLGLLAVLVAVFVWSRNASQSDDMARALTFAVMVLANVGLIAVSRQWGPSFARGQVGSNRAFLWVSAATLALLACVLAIPAVATLFAFQRPPAALLFAGLGAVLLCLGWFEGVKRFVAV